MSSIINNIKNYFTSDSSQEAQQTANTSSFSEKVHSLWNQASRSLYKGAKKLSHWIIDEKDPISLASQYMQETFKRKNIQQQTDLLLKRSEEFFQSKHLIERSLEEQLHKQETDLPTNQAKVTQLGDELKMLQKKLGDAANTFAQPKKAMEQIWHQEEKKIQSYLSSFSISQENFPKIPSFEGVNFSSHRNEVQHLHALLRAVDAKHGWMYATILDQLDQDTFNQLAFSVYEEAGSDSSRFGWQYGEYQLRLAVQREDDYPLNMEMLSLIRNAITRRLQTLNPETKGLFSL